MARAKAPATASAVSLRWQDTEESSAIGPDGPVGPFPENLWLHLCKSWRLSIRELRIIQEICADQELETIALSLEVPSEVVYRTLQRIYVKVGIGGRRELRWKTRMEYDAFVAGRRNSVPVPPIAA